jgi:heterodisulfide reductase subunit B
MKRYQYYPGCSVKGTGKQYEESLMAVFEALDTKLDELEDWNCCGATAYMSIDEDQAVALASRNLALAEREQHDLATPCNACYLVLNKTQRHLDEDPKICDRVTQALKQTGLDFRRNARVRHVLDILANDIGLDAIKAKVTKPLEGLKVAPYYGCQIVRPYALFDSQLDPVTMDHVLRASGAEVVDYPFKTRCCGGSQTGTIPEVGLHLVYTLLKEAQRQGADMVATVCPLCQFNLEIYQDKIAGEYGLDPIPVVYFTQILGLAMGLSEKRLGLQRSIVPVAPVLERRTADVA